MTEGFGVRLSGGGRGCVSEAGGFESVEEGGGAPGGFEGLRCGGDAGRGAVAGELAFIRIG